MGEAEPWLVLLSVLIVIVLYLSACNPPGLATEPGALTASLSESASFTNWGKNPFLITPASLT